MIEEERKIGTEENPEKSEKAFTEEELAKVVGGYTTPDGREIVCPVCGSSTLYPNFYSLYCDVCKKIIALPEHRTR